MVRSDIRFTYEDYKSLPESDTKRYELLEGELVVVPSPNVEHQSVSRKLEFLLVKFVEDNKLGTVFYAPLDVVLGENVVQPDIMYISRERSDIITKDAIRGAPDLVIEILSPATSVRDRGIKRKLYGKHGVREMWIVDTEKKTIEVANPGKTGLETTGIYKTGELLVSPLLPGLRLKPDKVFR